MKKRFQVVKIIILITVVLFSQGISGVYAAELSGIEALFPEHMLAGDVFEGEFTAESMYYLETLPPAEALKTLNVLRGDKSGDLMLDKTANRMEGATMLVRLLGAEEEALRENFSHPFTDVDAWAAPYIGYLYKNNLTNGIGSNLYGSRNPIDEKAYLTFLLRALGYSDKNGADFIWDTVESAAIRIGLLESGETMNSTALFQRSRLAVLSWRAMLLDHKTQNQALLVFLYEQGMISEKSLEALLQPSDLPLLDQWLALLPIMEDGFVKHQGKMEFLLNEAMAESDIQEYIDILLEWVAVNTGRFHAGYETMLRQEGNQYTLFLSPVYVNTQNEDDLLFSYIDQILAAILTPDMTEYGKEKAVHDYLITTLKYDTSAGIGNIPESSAHALGALETGKAVCSAYSELMLLLLNRAGIPCRMVTGTGDGVDHAWNIVLVEGERYHVDVTYDDPVTEAGEDILQYDYFNLTDAEMKRDHVWEAVNYPPCTATAENYFVKNKLILSSPAELKAAVKGILQSGETECTYKLQGFDTAQLDISKMMNEINKEINYIMSGYSYSLGEASQVIRLEILLR